ncbi:glycosyltransferase family 4 protein [Vibrio metschnikovii]|uniref:glycosyltransferase family 4 protein n=1 Tax=Vibrio metschnikovii TaxID=28172 RepID=UPI002FC9E228
MKVLVCASYLHAWNSLRPEAAIFIEFVRQGHQVTIMTQGESEHVSKLEAHGIRVIDSYPKYKICFDTIKKIRHELKTHNYDICYAFNSKTIPNAAFACIGIKVKLVAYRGTTGGLYRHDPSAYLTQLHPRVDGIICVSEAVRQDVVKRVWKNKKNVVTIYKGHELDWYTVPPAARSEFGLREDDVVAITAAHVRPSKGISVLLEATKYISAPNFHLVLAGSGYEPHFEEMKLSPMADRIHYIGHRTDVPSIMCMADFQIQPSVSGEGLPRTIVEAMANGKTSVVTTTGGAPELVIDGETGFIVPAGDAKALGYAIESLVKNKALCTAMSQAAQQRLCESFNSRITVKKHLEFFEKLILS